MNEVIDISMEIYQGMPVYPNNPEVEINELNTGHSTISKITFGSHTGTHVDFPKHCIKEGKSSSDFTLETFFGPAKVFDFSHVEGEAVTQHALSLKEINKGDIILLKTRNSTLPLREFNSNYVYLDGDAAKYLAQKEIKLFGIDYLSVKKYQSRDNTPHTNLLEKNIPIIEGIDLKSVEEGNYIFMGFPLKLQNLDGAPLRAGLLKV